MRTDELFPCPTGMGHFKQKTPDRPSAAQLTTLAKTVAPEDLLVGDYVTFLQTVTELPSCLWCADATTLPFDQPVRIRFMPVPAGIPLKVKAVCLPFVLVKRPSGDHETLDVRQCQLARIDGRFAVSAWKAYKKKGSKKRKRLRH